MFYIPEEVSQHFAGFGDRGRQAAQDWKALLERFRSIHPETAAQFDRVIRKELPSDLQSKLPAFSPDAKGLATRASSGQVLTALAEVIPELLGGSADLTGSNKTDIKGEQPFSPTNHAGRYIHYGVREHAMAAMMNGMALYGGLIPYGGTFLVFSDYARPSIRLAALMGLQVIYVFTHDSIGLGEDGPTHQPVEQLAALRAIPNLTVIRPADANEAAYGWLAALNRKDGPTALVLTRQAVPTFDRTSMSPAEDLFKGAYILTDIGDGQPQVILMATGSEVQLILEAAKDLVDRGLSTRVVSFPSWELFEKQAEAYQKHVLPDEIHRRVAVEAGRAMGWHRWVGESGRIISVDRFGASAPYQEIYQHFGLTVDAVVRAVLDLVDSKSDNN